MGDFVYQFWQIEKEGIPEDVNISKPWAEVEQELEREANDWVIQWMIEWCRYLKIMGEMEEKMKRERVGSSGEEWLNVLSLAFFTPWCKNELVFSVPSLALIFNPWTCTSPDFYHQHITRVFIIKALISMGFMKLESSLKETCLFLYHVNSATALKILLLTWILNAFYNL